MTDYQQDTAKAYDEAGITAGKATMYALAQRARDEHPTAKEVVLGESDQGSWLWVEGVVTEESDEEELVDDDGLASCLYTDIYTLRELYSQYDVRGLIDYGKRMGIASFRMDVAKVIAECAPPVSEPSDIKPNQVEVWSLLVISAESPSVVTVHASEDACVAYFREYYDPEDEGADLSFNDLADSLNIQRWAIDVHTVTLP